MTLTAPSTASPQTRSSRLGALAASGSLLVLSTGAAASIAASHASIVHAVHLLVTLR